LSKPLKKEATFIVLPDQIKYSAAEISDTDKEVENPKVDPGMKTIY
jgi:hypothetical protein